MERPEIVLFFDYVDPLSYLLEHELREMDRGSHPSLGIERVPLELCPPPKPLLDPEQPAWAGRWKEAETAGSDLGLVLAEPTLLPWTRKAHELVFHAADHGKGPEIHQAVFDAVFVHGRDVGRIDVLVDIARASGLDGMETKAVLDVDKHAGSVEASRSRAQDAGVDDPPVLLAHGEILRGFHNRDALRTFLCSP
jgi:predicted DsbA family dithiol-disulfide isomerase